MKQISLIAVCMMATIYSIAQTPFEVMAGNKQTLYYAFVQKDIDSIGRWNIFSQSLFTVHRTDKSLNTISIDGQLTYMLNPWLGISAGGGFDGQRFNPTIGLSLSYINPKGNFSINAFPTIQLAKPTAFDLFSLISYTPSFNQRWGLFTQAIIGTNLGVQKTETNQKREVLGVFTRHNISTQILRLGLNYRQKFQFGVGLDLNQFGKGEGTFTNVGLFIRCQLD